MKPHEGTSRDDLNSLHAKALKTFDMATRQLLCAIGRCTHKESFGMSAKLLSAHTYLETWLPRP
jgi:hypothetical protein